MATSGDNFSEGAPLIDHLAEADANGEQAMVDIDPAAPSDHSEDGNLDVFEEELQEHFLTRSRGSSINVSFDNSTSTTLAGEEERENELPGDVFHEQLLNHPTQLRMYMKEKLRYHFMSPLEKWRYRRVFPWKMIFQIIKIFVVTVQIILFGVDSSQFYDERSATETSLKVYFLNDWDSIRDIYFYPPTDGPYAVYTENELFDSIDSAVKRYARVTVDPIGSFKYDSPDASFVPPVLCLTYFKAVRVFPYNQSIGFNNEVIYRCLTLNQTDYSNFSIVTFFNETGISLDLQSFIAARLDFGLSTEYRRHRAIFDQLVTYRMLTSIVYQNKYHNGLVKVKLNVSSAADHGVSPIGHLGAQLARQLLNVAAISLSTVSLFLCKRSIVRGYLLLRKVIEYFRTHQQLELGWADRFEFVDLWLCLIVINDLLVISGTSIKMTLELNYMSQERLRWASVLLGTGLLLVWSGILRYLGYFSTYNVLILTLKRSTPNLLKFLIGAFILFIGYGLCGWVVLSPHHMKFKTISTTFECLYAITNGDDIFATFALATNDYSEHGIPPLIWWFTRLYLYTFVVLFICVVINLLYAVIIDAYDAIKESSEIARKPKTSFLHQFIAQRLEKASSANYMLDETIEGDMNAFEVFYRGCSCFSRRRSTYTDNWVDSASVNAPAVAETAPPPPTTASTERPSTTAKTNDSRATAKINTMLT